MIPPPTMSTCLLTGVPQPHACGLFGQFGRCAAPKCRAQFAPWDGPAALARPPHPPRGPNSRLGTALRRSCAMTDPPTQWIGVIEDECRFRSYIGAAGDVRQDATGVRSVGGERCLEHGADDALLPPGLAGSELAGGMQAGELGAGTRPA